MLKRFSLKNYRNFKDEIMINFEDIAGYQFNTECITNGILSKMLIYGKNATGKTNLGRVIISRSSTTQFTTSAPVVDNCSTTSANR